MADRYRDGDRVQPSRHHRIEAVEVLLCGGDVYLSRAGACRNGSDLHSPVEYSAGGGARDHAADAISSAAFHVPFLCRNDRDPRPPLLSRLGSPMGPGADNAGMGKSARRLRNRNSNPGRVCRPRRLARHDGGQRLAASAAACDTPAWGLTGALCHTLWHRHLAHGVARAVQPGSADQYSRLESAQIRDGAAMARGTLGRNLLCPGTWIYRGLRDHFRFEAAWRRSPVRRDRRDDEPRGVDCRAQYAAGGYRVRDANSAAYDSAARRSSYARRGSRKTHRAAGRALRYQSMVRGSSRNSVRAWHRPVLTAVAPGGPVPIRGCR